MNNMRELLEIVRPESETSFSVIGRMNALMRYVRARKSYGHFIPFLQTYEMVTNQVAQKQISDASYFKDFSALRQLDVLFASLYFTPMREGLEMGSMPSPWRTYGTYCAKPLGIPFVQLLLGVNAHINADLCTCLVELGYTQAEDYEKINAVLEEVVPEVMRFLAVSHADIFGMTGVVLKKFITEQFTQVVVRWRMQAWKNAAVIRARGDVNYRDELHAKTEQAAVDIIALFTNPAHALDLPSAQRKLDQIGVVV